jgi:hypothetical protein
MHHAEIKRVTDRDKPMTNAVMEMTEIVRAAAEPWAPGDSVKAAINRASRRLSISPRRATTFWYSRPAAILAHEADSLRRWYAQHCDQEAARLVQRLAEIRRRQEAFEKREHAQGLVSRFARSDVDQRDERGRG